MNMKGIEELDIQSLDGNDEHRFQYNGKEKEESFGLNWTDYGWRNMDTQLGRWNGVDPLAEKFVSTSSYVSMNNNPIFFIDPDGRKVIGANEEELKAIITDLNRIYKDKYGVDNAFVFNKEVKKEKVRTNDWKLGDPSTWGNVFEEPEYEERITEVTYSIGKNEKFDWSTDEYTEAMSELIDVETTVMLDIIPDNGSEYKNNIKGQASPTGFYDGHGGGFTVHSRYIILSDKLKESTSENKSKWTLGGVALHELLYHVSTSGMDQGGNPNKMRKHYGLKTGRKHGQGNNQLKILKQRRIYGK